MLRIGKENIFLKLIKKTSVLLKENNMHVRKHNNTILISFQYDPQIISFVKSLEGRKYLPHLKEWSIPLAGSHASIDRLAKRGFTIHPDLWAEVRKDQEQAREVEALALLPDTDFTTTLPLFPYQKVGAAFLWKIGSGLIGDSPGTGKTIQVMALAEKAGAEKILVFCPAVLKHQWENELKTFVPHRKAVVIEGTKAERVALWQEEADYYIANYELLLRDFDNMNCREWDYIFADEATKICNPQAKQSKVIKKLRAKKRVAMSGTPISNRAQDCWNLIDFTNPGAFGNYWAFLGRYCLKDRFGGIFAYQNMDELREKLRRYMIRRTKEEVLPELPAKITTDVPFVLSEEEAKLQKKIKMEILHEIEAADINKIEYPMRLQFTIAKFQRLRQLADSLELLGENKKSTKLEVLKELLQENLENGRKAIIFSEFAKMCDILKRELPEYNPVMITGDVPNEVRQPLLDRFNADPECKICIMSSAGMWGLNITAASIVVNYDLPFSLSKLEQRIGRAHRIGQKNKVQVFNLLGKGTADMAIKKIIHSKAELAGQVLGDTPVTMNDIKDMLTYD